MPIYAPELTLNEAHKIYLETNGFDEANQKKKWVKVQYGPFFAYFPNTKGRIRLLKYHDLHHILTGYSTALTGEAEIGAWDVAVGCPGFGAGWILNLLGFADGLIINPRGVYRAFIRGRQSSNLYPVELSEQFLSRTVGEVRRELGLDKEIGPASLSDKEAFALWALISLVILLTVVGIVLVPLALAIIFSLHVFGR
jgi:ubiquinone biosynthesis protein Coq4